MKILVTNNTLGALGGSETYAYALISELHSRDGITVHAFSKSLGLICNKLREIGVTVINNITDTDYDLILASHISTIQFIKHLKGTKVQTCHGVYHPLEQPARGVDEYVSITKEVQTHLLKKGFESNIIHNGIDCDRFKPKKDLNTKVKSILSLSQSEPLNVMLRAVTSNLGIKLTCLNKFRNPIFNVEDLINESDLVISLGRGVYESMACGRNVLVLDWRTYANSKPIGDGIINESNINDFILNNCSGRFSNKVFTNQDIENSILDYDINYGNQNRKYALKNLNIKTQVDKYINLL